MNKPRVLLYDIENSPSLAYIWQLYHEVTSTEMVENDWYVLCWAAKWVGERKVHSGALPDYSSYKNDPTNDKPTLKALWKLLDEADICIAHNGQSFDRRKVNARFVYHGMRPPSPYRMIDTLLIARKEFMFLSNKLNDLGTYFKVGEKVDTGGFQLWKDCMNGDPIAWRKMVRYCKGDILLLEKVYYKLLPYMTNHPNLAAFNEDVDTVACPRCNSENIHFRGYAYTNVSKFQRFKCTDCGGWGRVRDNELLGNKKVSTVSL